MSACESRKYTGLTGAVGHHRRQQCRFHADPGQSSGTHDRTVQLLDRHRTDEELAIAQQFGQGRIADAMGVEVGAYAQDDPDTAVGVAGRAGEHRDEPGALGCVLAEGEDLLELVQHEQ